MVAHMLEPVLGASNGSIYILTHPWCRVTFNYRLMEK